jgi:hypothetical protein
MSDRDPSDAKPAAPDLPPPDFSTFIVSFWTTALFQMGQLPDPETGRPVAPDKLMASQTIETLKMLRRKTEGNLEAEEAELFDKILYELHMRFVDLDG